MFLITFMRILELFAMFIFFNVNYSFLVSKVLRTVHEMMTESLFRNPFDDYNWDYQDSARIYRYKLTAVGIQPWFFQNSGIENAGVFIWYLLIAILYRSKWRRNGGVRFWLAKVRLYLFLCYFTDNLSMSVRTIDYFSSMFRYNTPGSVQLKWNQWLSLAASIFFMIVYSFEVVLLFDVSHESNNFYEKQLA